MYPILFKIGPLKVGSYGVMLALGFLTALYLLNKEMKRKGLDVTNNNNLLVAAIIGGILGARLYYLIQNWKDMLAEPLGMIFTGEGLVWYGGLIGGSLMVIVIIKRRKLPFLPTIDAATPSLALGYVFGRMGCQLAGDGDYGIPTNLPWAISYPNGLVPTMERVHPTPIYEMMAFLLIFLVLWRIRKISKPPGWLFSIYLGVAGFERLLVEFIRRNERVLFSLTEAQIISILMIIIGLIWFLYLERKAKDNLIV